MPDASGQRATRCPCCGRDLPDYVDPARLVEYLPVNGIRLAILRILVARFGREVPTRTIVARAWAGAANGGPLTAGDCVRVQTFKLRKLLAPYGLTIRGRQGGSHRMEWK